MDLELATVPLTRFQVRNERRAGRHHGAARGRRSRQRRDPLLRRRRRRHRRGRRSARSSGCSTARTSGARSPATSATSCSRRARSSSTRPRSRPASTSTRLRDRAFKVVLDYSFGAASIVMPNVLGEARRRGAGGQPVRGDASAPSRRRPRDTRVKRIGDLVRTSGSDLGFVFDPDGETATDHRRRRARRSPPTRRCSRSSTLVCRAPSRRAHRAAGVGEPRGRAHRRRARRDDHAGRSCRPRTSWRSRRSAASTSPASQEGGFIWPDVPARVRRGRHAGASARPARAGRPAAVGGRRRRCRASHIAHETVPTPWERKGAVMREMVERAKDQQTRARRRREDPLPRRLGAGAARPRGARSRTCGPRPAATPSARRLAQEYAQPHPPDRCADRLRSLS